jgi:hypothetical protein
MTALAALTYDNSSDEMSLLDRQKQARDLMRARDAGHILPWAEFSRAPGGMRTFGRDMRGTEHCALIVRGRPGSLVWAISGLTDNPNLIMAAGVVRATEADPFEKAMQLADSALVEMDSDDPTTYTALLSEDDTVMLMNRDLISEDTIL